MPSIEFNKQELLALIGQKDDEDLVHAITFLGTDFEEVTDKTVKTEVFPNRPDLLSMQGMARALNSLEHATGLQKYEVNKSEYVVQVDQAVAKVRPHTRCCVIKGLTITDQLLDDIITIQEKLHITFGRNRQRVAIGIYPMENITFPISYTAKKPEDIRFQPLEAHTEMTGLQILEEHDKGKEFAHLLEGQEVYPLFIDANNNVLSMPPIINAEHTGKVTTATTDLFIECSGFAPHVLDICIAMLASACGDMGGEIYNVHVQYKDHDVSSPDLSGTPMEVKLDYIRKRSGLDITDEEIVTLCKKMGHDATIKEQQVLVTVPNYREDILHNIDIVEDICIAYGFNNIAATPQHVSGAGQSQPYWIMRQACTELLIGLGYTEAATYNLTSVAQQDHMMHGQGKIKDHLITLQQAKSESYATHCSWLTPQIVDVFAKNAKHSYPQAACTFNRVVITTDAGSVKEEERLAFGQIGNDKNYTLIKQHLNYLLDRIGVQEYHVVESDHPSFIAGRCGRIIVDNKSIGFLGELHPEVMTNHGLEYPIVTCELILDNIQDIIDLK